MSTKTLHESINKLKNSESQTSATHRKYSSKINKSMNNTKNPIN